VIELWWALTERLTDLWCRAMGGHVIEEGRWGILDKGQCYRCERFP
jgi:hypothetical protein